jgi:hypothetical protein
MPFIWQELPSLMKASSRTDDNDGQVHPQQRAAASDSDETAAAEGKLAMRRSSSANSSMPLPVLTAAHATVTPQVTAVVSAPLVPDGMQLVPSTGLTGHPASTAHIQQMQEQVQRLSRLLAEQHTTVMEEVQFQVHVLICHAAVVAALLSALEC